MNFSNVYIYGSASTGVDPQKLAAGARKIFPNRTFHVREPFFAYWAGGPQLIASTAITDTKQPFDSQPAGAGPLYDGFELQREMGSLISGSEQDIEHVHVVLSDLLSCTFDEDDWRYHARAVICGTPSIVSVPGIVEAPARPREYYYLSRPGLLDEQWLAKKFRGRFIGYGDDLLADAALVYLIQALFFFVTDGEPFCGDRTCALYNAHWQEELVGMARSISFCPSHRAVLDRMASSHS